MDSFTRNGQIRQDDVSSGQLSVNGKLPEDEEKKERDVSVKDEVSVNNRMKICHVCGDLAKGYNAGTVACESCKVFFRRNAMREEDLKCPFKGNCLISVTSRRSCPKCRLIKCLEVGMKSEGDAGRKRRGHSEDGGEEEPPKKQMSGDGEITRKSSAMENMAHFSPPPSVTPDVIDLQAPAIGNSISAWMEKITDSTSPGSVSSATVSARLDQEEHVITIRIPRKALLQCLLEDNARRQQMLGQMLQAAAARRTPNGPKDGAPDNQPIQN